MTFLQDKDKRKTIVQTNNLPFNAISKVKCSYFNKNDKKCYEQQGMGFYLNPTTIITAGKVITNLQSEQLRRQINIYPLKDWIESSTQQNKIWNPIKVVSCRVFHSNSFQSNNDLAILKIDSNQEDGRTDRAKYKYLKIRHDYDDQKQKQNNILMVGIEERQGKQIVLSQQSAQVVQKDGIIYSKHQVNEHYVGTPILLKVSQNQYEVIGIHLGTNNYLSQGMMFSSEDKRIQQMIQIYQNYDFQNKEQQQLFKNIDVKEQNIDGPDKSHWINRQKEDQSQGTIVQQKLNLSNYANQLSKINESNDKIRKLQESTFYTAILNQSEDTIQLRSIKISQFIFRLVKRYEYQYQYEKLSKSLNAIKHQVQIFDTITNRFILPQQIDTSKIWSLFSRLQQNDHNMAVILVNQIFNQPKSSQELTQSQTLKQQFIKKAANEQCVETVILKLAQILQEDKFKVSFSRKSTLKSQLTMKILAEQFLSNIAVIEETIEQSSRLNFQSLSEEKQLEKFYAAHKRNIQKYTHANPEKIVYREIVKGSIKVIWMIDLKQFKSTKQLHHYLAGVNQTQKLKVKLKLHPFFKSFSVSPNDFNPMGNMRFAQTKSQVQTRGGWAYYQPVQCKRYGLDVLQKYDNGNNQWIQMYGLPGQWAVGFHGVKSPFSQFSSQMNVFESIMSGLNKNQMLNISQRGLHQVSTPLNMENQMVDKGVYCSPHIQQALNYAGPCGVKQKAQNYYLIFQCRLNPSKIKVGDTNIHWVLNKTQDIRPYGVILVKQQVRQKYQKDKQLNYKTLFKEQFGFKYQKYKVQIDRYLLRCEIYQRQKEELLRKQRKMSTRSISSIEKSEVISDGKSTDNINNTFLVEWQKLQEEDLSTAGRQSFYQSL